MKNDAEKRCDLRQITVHSASKSKVVSVISPCKVTEIANERERNEGVKARKWLRKSMEMALHMHKKRLFFSIWSWREVLKMRKKIDGIREKMLIFVAINPTTYLTEHNEKESYSAPCELVLPAERLRRKPHLRNDVDRGNAATTAPNDCKAMGKRACHLCCQDLSS